MFSFTSCTAKSHWVTCSSVRGSNHASRQPATTLLVSMYSSPKKMNFSLSSS